MMSPDEYFKRMYPGLFSEPSVLDIILTLFFLSLPLLIPYLYIRFFESRVVSLIRCRFIPFIMFRLHLGKLVSLINRILKTKIFRNSRSRV